MPRLQSTLASSDVQSIASDIVTRGVVAAEHHWLVAEAVQKMLDTRRKSQRYQDGVSRVWGALPATWPLRQLVPAVRARMVCTGLPAAHDKTRREHVAAEASKRKLPAEIPPASWPASYGSTSLIST